MLDGKVAVITGAARGQGAAEAELFVAEGASVVISDVLDDLGEALAARLGERATFLHHDVSRPEDWEAAIALATGRYGSLDVLVNNAAVYRVNTMLETPLEEYEEVLRINQWSHFLGMREAAPVMQQSGGGSIVNVSSIGGTGGQPGAFAYATTKWAIRGMTKIAALELAPLGIRVNCVLPGPVDTAMFDVSIGSHPREAVKAAVEAGVPLGRFATPDDIAPMVAFLASDRSSYCTGADFVVDGGFTAKV